MKRTDAAEFALESLKKAGAEKAQVTASNTVKQELNVEANEISLFRTVVNQNLTLKVIKDQRLATTNVNKLDRESILKASAEVMEILKAGSPDEAYDISAVPAKKHFEHGVMQPDQDKMYSRLDELMETNRKEFPLIIQEGVTIDHSKFDHVLLNSNGVEFTSTQGHYDFSSMFTAKNNGKASSFNYTGGSLRELSRPLMDNFGLRELLGQSSEQIETKAVPEKFVGDLILTPHCLQSFLYNLLGMLSDGPMISGTSLLKDKLGQKITSPFSVKAEPRGNDFASHEYYNTDGFESENMTIIDQGILKSFRLSLYGSKKTGKERAKSAGTNMYVSGGNDSREDLIKSVKKGILLCRFSGGNPGENGDFSGVAKNSYYVENGKILYPVSETMISGNILDLFSHVEGLSKEQINFGSSRFPWMRAVGATVSGK